MGIGRTRSLRFDNDLFSDIDCIHIPLRNLDTRSLEVSRILLHLRYRRKQRRTDISTVLGSNVPSNGSALVQDKPVIVNIRDLAERVDGHVLDRLVLALQHVDVLVLERDIVLIEYNCDAGRAGGDKKPI